MTVIEYIIVIIAVSLYAYDREHENKIKATRLYYSRACSHANIICVHAVCGIKIKSHFILAIIHCRRS